MRKFYTVVVTAAGVAAFSLAAAGAASAENATAADTSAAVSRGTVTSTTTTHVMPFFASDKTGTLHKGSSVEVRCWTPGQVVDGNDIWFMLGGGLDFAPRAAIQHEAGVPECGA